MIRSLCALGACFAALPVLSDTPRVVTDILPVHGLVSAVMADIGTPDLIVGPGVSPHHAALRPSNARDLQQADLVIWMGPGLLPFFDRARAALNQDAREVILLDLPQTLKLSPRRAGGHDHGDRHDHTHDHGDETQGSDDDHVQDTHGAGDHDAHEAHAGDDHHAQDAHGADDHDAHEAHGADDHDAHGDSADDRHAHTPDAAGRSGVDPHAWLDPRNAMLWLDAIAEALSDHDPANARTYARNAAAARERLDMAADALRTRARDLHDVNIVFGHDAFQYLEARLDLPTHGTLRDTDDSAAIPGAVATVKGSLDAGKAVCFFADVGEDASLAGALDADLTVIEIDALGTRIAPGPDHYPQLLNAIGAALETCALAENAG